MLVEQSQLTHEAALRAEVVVIGAGPAGITIAEQLAQARIRVLLLESGGRHPNRYSDGLSRGESVGAPFPLRASRRRGFGGTSNNWTAETGLRLRALDPIDFEARPGVRDGEWPFSASELAPYYGQANRGLGVSTDYGAERWLPGARSCLAWEGGPELAMFQFANHRTYLERYASIARSPYIDLVLNATVATIQSNEDGSGVHHLEVVTGSGKRFIAVGEIYVLAGGGLENARMLLSSASITGASLGNETGNVGRYFMDHMSLDTGWIAPGCDLRREAAVFREQFTGEGLKFQPMLWAGDADLRREGLANAAFWVTSVDQAFPRPGVQATRGLKVGVFSEPRHVTGRQAMAILRDLPSITGWAYRRMYRPASQGRVLALRIMAEQEPNRDSRVSLSDKTDALGIRQLKLDWRLSKNDRETLRRHQQRLSHRLENRGAGRIISMIDEEDDGAIMASHHHIGTTRMSKDSRQGVVDADCRVHTVANLYVAGSSVFPTGGYVNPTLTIVALAIRLAEHIASRLAPPVVVAGACG